MMRLFRSKGSNEEQVTTSPLYQAMEVSPRSFTTDKDGNTPLHLAAMAKDDDQTLQTVFETYSKNDVKLMAATINNNAKLPYDLIDKSKNARLTKAKYKLRKYTLSNTTAPMDEPLCIDDVLNRYYQPGNTTLTMHLNIACDMVNKTRTIIKESSNHPTFTFGINAQRTHDNLLLMRSIYSPDNISANQDTPPIFTLNDILNISALIEWQACGNCHEFSTLALKQLHEHKKNKLIGELGYIVNCDHVVTVIGRDQTSDPSNYHTWGDKAVICDAWLGKVYPASYIPTELKDSKRYVLVEKNIGYTVLINYNSDVHKLHITSDPIHSSYQSKSKTKFLFGLFHSMLAAYPTALTDNKSSHRHTISMI